MQEFQMSSVLSNVQATPKEKQIESGQLFINMLINGFAS